MKKYKLLKDLPTFKAGEIFEISSAGNLVKRGECISDCTVAYAAQALEKFPSIIKDWFEEIPEKPKTVWDLEDGEAYYLLNPQGGIAKRPWFNGEVCENIRNTGSAFATEEDAEKELARRKAKQILLRDTKGFKPDWKNLDQDKYRVAYNASKDTLFVEWQLDGVHSNIHFANEEDAKASIITHEKEWKIYLGVEGQWADIL